MDIRVLPCVLFAASLAAQFPYRMVDLGVLPGASGSIARGMSPDGTRVVGWSGLQPFVWQEGVGMQPLPLLPGYTTASAYDVDDQGRVAGSMGNPGVAVRWDPSGAIVNLGTLAGTRNSFGLAIDPMGRVVGYSDALPNSTLYHAFLWQQGTGMVDLIPGPGTSLAYDVNQLGQVTGYGDTSAFRYTPGRGVEWLTPPVGYAFSTGWSINDAGQVAGNVTNAAGTTQRVARWTEGRGWEVVPGQGDDNVASGINSFGQMVGAAIQPSGHRAFLYTDGLGMQSLSWIVDPANSALKQGFAINDRGQISGYRFDNNLTQWRGFRLDPQFVNVYGQGCAGSSGLPPKLLVAGMPRSGERIAVLLAGGVPGGFAVLAMSTAQASTPIGGCTALLAMPGIASVFLPLDATGQARLPIDLPAGLVPGACSSNTPRSTPARRTAPSPSRTACRCRSSRDRRPPSE